MVILVLRNRHRRVWKRGGFANNVFLWRAGLFYLFAFVLHAGDVPSSFSAVALLSRTVRLLKKKFRVMGNVHSSQLRWRFCHRRSVGLSRRWGSWWEKSFYVKNMRAVDYRMCCVIASITYVWVWKFRYRILKDQVGFEVENVSLWNWTCGLIPCMHFEGAAESINIKVDGYGKRKNCDSIVQAI